jgi:hypothetical protein
VSGGLFMAYGYGLHQHIKLDEALRNKRLGVH